jgi:hypothetical protein
VHVGAGEVAHIGVLRNNRCSTEVSDGGCRARPRLDARLRIFRAVSWAQLEYGDKVKWSIY